MSSGFSTDFKELVRSQTDIVDLIGEHTALEAKGRDYVGLCRFHDDHRPSMTVSRERQSFKCWACGEGGDCFSFIMKVESVDFPGALEILARRAGLEMPRQGRAQGGSDEKGQLYDVLAWAEQEFHRCLLQSPAAEPARRYLQQRGLSAATIAKFKLGYHPDNWEWLQKQVAGKFTPEQLQAARLATERRDSAGFIDYFVNRVMFPIRDERGRPVAFGGRGLPGTEQESRAKYFNSPESMLFAKSRLLYGLDVARPAIREQGSAIVVEGYTDCISAHQSGIENAVATLGTALTDSHVRTLKRFAERVILVYDGDLAGRNAAERSIGHFLALDVDLRVLTLPDGLDPAEFLAQRGPDALRKLTETAPEAWEFKLRSLIEQRGIGSVDARRRILAEMLELVSSSRQLAGTAQEDIILGKLSQRLGLNEKSVRKELADLKRGAARRGQSAGAKNLILNSAGRGNENSWTRRADRHLLMERELLEILLVAPRFVAAVREVVGSEDYHDNQMKGILQACFDLAEQGLEPTYERLMSAIEDPELKRLVVELEQSARDKNIEQLLRHDAGSEATERRPRFLEQAVERWHWRRREQTHELSRGQMAQQSESTGAWDEQTIAALRQVNEFHEARAGKKASS